MPRSTLEAHAALLADDVRYLIGHSQMVRHLQPVLADRGRASEAMRLHGASAAFRAAEIPLAVVAAGPAGGDVTHVMGRAAADAEARRRGANPPSIG